MTLKPVLLTLAMWLLAPSSQAVQLVDDRGITVTLSQPPKRIVSLLPSLTETVCELGQCARLVCLGIENYLTLKILW